MQRTIIIGDVHGCSEELRTLLADLRATASDRIVFVGDFVAKGPDSEGVLALARNHGALGVRGNHDERVLDYRELLERGGDVHGLRQEHLELARTLSSDALKYLRTLPYTLELPELATIVVHGGLVPNVALSQQDPKLMLTMRSIDPHTGHASKRLEDGVPWASVWPGPQHVVFGHDALRKLQRYPHATGLDTGCVYGGTLSALVLPERRIVQVPAKRVYSPPGDGAS